MRKKEGREESWKVTGTDIDNLKLEQGFNRRECKLTRLDAQQRREWERNDRERWGKGPVTRVRRE